MKPELQNSIIKFIDRLKKSNGYFRAVPQEAVTILKTLIDDVTAYRKNNEGTWNDLIEYLEEEKKDERSGKNRIRVA